MSDHRNSVPCFTAGAGAGRPSQRRLANKPVQRVGASLTNFPLLCEAQIEAGSGIEPLYEDLQSSA